jgi:hypothetical protein
MIKKTPPPFTVLFFDSLKRNQSDISNIYQHLFSLMKFEDLEKELKYLFELSEGDDDYFKESGKTDWFGIFHKSIRQTDFFQECYRKIKEPQLTNLEEKEFKFLRHKVREKGYDKTDPTGQFMFNGEYNRFLELNDMKRNEQYDESIGGHLDMILWNTIQVDKNELYNVFLRTFSEYKLQKNEKGTH